MINKFKFSKRTGLVKLKKTHIESLDHLMFDLVYQSRHTLQELICQYCQSPTSDQRILKSLEFSKTLKKLKIKSEDNIESLKIIANMTNLVYLEI